MSDEREPGERITRWLEASVEVSLVAKRAAADPLPTEPPSTVEELLRCSDRLLSQAPVLHRLGSSSTPFLLGVDTSQSYGRPPERALQLLCSPRTPPAVKPALLSSRFLRLLPRPFLDPLVLPASCAALNSHEVATLKLT